MNHFFICPVCENDLQDTPGDMVSCDDCRTNFHKYTLAEFTTVHGTAVDTNRMEAVTMNGINRWYAELLQQQGEDLYDCRTMVKGLEKRIADLLPVEDNDFGPEPD